MSVSSIRRSKFVVVPVGWGHFSYLKLEGIAVITDGGTMGKCYRTRDPFVLNGFDELYSVRKVWIFSHFHFDHYSLMAAFQKATETRNWPPFIGKDDWVVVPYQSTPECRKAIADVIGFLAFYLLKELPRITVDEALTIVAPWVSGGSSVKRIAVRAEDRIIIESKDALFEYLFLSPNPFLLERLDPLLCVEVSKKIVQAFEKIKEEEPERFREFEEIFYEIKGKILGVLEVAHDCNIREPLTYRIRVGEGFKEGASETDFRENVGEISMQERVVIDALKSAQRNLKRVLGKRISRSLNSTSISYALTGRSGHPIIYLGDLQDESLINDAIHTLLYQRGFPKQSILIAPHHGNAWGCCLARLDPFLTVFTRCNKHFNWRNNLAREYDRFGYHAYITHGNPLEFSISN